MPTERDWAIRRASRNIAGKLFETAMPEALVYLQEAEAWAFAPPLERIKFGPKDETLRVASIIFDSIADALQDIADAVREATSLDHVQELFLRSLAKQLSGRVDATKHEEAVIAMEKIFEPPLADQISVVPFERDRREGCERRLQECVLKVVDPQDGSISTAFALCSNRHVLTAAHVARGHAYLDLFYQEEKGQGEVIHKDREKDVAILRVEINSWARFWRAGLRPAPLAIRPDSELCGVPVVCLGYQDAHVFVDPVAVCACTPLFFPVKRVRIEQVEHRCLVLVVTEKEGNVCITYGMSGGPVMDSRIESCEVIAMVVGVWQPGAERRVQAYYSPYRRWEPLSAREFGFGITLSEVAESWPEFRRCCLK